MRLVVTTWNMQGARGLDIDAVAAHIRGAGSDVVLLQEIQRRQARRLAKALDARSLRWAFKHWPIRTPAEGMAVLGVTTPAKARAIALSYRWRFWYWRRRIAQLAHVDGLQLVNLHLTSHDDPERRGREIARVVRKLDSPSLLAGDLNETPSGTMFQQLVSAGMRDAWLSARKDDKDAGFTNWSSRKRRWSGPTNQRIDYVWVSPEVDVVAAQLPRYADAGFAVFPDLSDHLPLTVTVEVAPG
jgi:endonuclease/exonuclease/phosphatase family metal-dependent hydrolase